MSNNKGLLFIPDISGFTRFINETEIEHSRLIIQELLELIINANKINLEVSEVEGDAILFYKFGASPSMGEIYTQVQEMFCEFHKHLIAYDNSRFCHCKACCSAINLSLKVITHYGEFTSYKVKNFSKLIGKDVIVAHQLLKNDIDNHEYWLVTDNLLEDYSNLNLEEWMQWNTSAKKTENGEVLFHYIQLGELKNTIKPEPSIAEDLSEKMKMITLEEEFDTDIISLIHGVADFNYKNRWIEGVKSVREVSHFLPRVGNKCSCEMENGEIFIYRASGYQFSPERIEFTEIEEKTEYARHFVLQKINDRKTKLTWNFYIKKNLFEELSFKLLHKTKFESSFNKSLKNLKELVKEIQLSLKARPTV